MVYPRDSQRTDRRLLSYEHQFLAPDLLFAETANAIWKKVRRREFKAEKGMRLVRDLERTTVKTIPWRTLAEGAYVLATATDRSVYDAMYLALAVRLDTRMITGDLHLAATLGWFTALRPQIQAVHDLMETKLTPLQQWREVQIPDPPVTQEVTIVGKVPLHRFKLNQERLCLQGVSLSRGANSCRDRLRLVACFCSREEAVS